MTDDLSNEDDLTIRHHRSFGMVLFDSITLLDLCGDKDNEFIEDTLSRGSIVCSLLLPEIAANICIESLHLERSVFEDVDKLSVLAKLDIYLRMSSKRYRIDRGDNAVNLWRSLRKCRDRYVHPKTVKVEYDIRPDDTMMPKEDIDRTLGIPSNPESWAAEEAKVVMRSVHLFLRYFFETCCHFSPAQVSNLLFHDGPVPSTKNTIFQLANRDLKPLLKSWNVDLSYIRLVYRDW